MIKIGHSPGAYGAYKEVHVSCTRKTRQTRFILVDNKFDQASFLFLFFFSQERTLRFPSQRLVYIKNPLLSTPPLSLFPPPFLDERETHPIEGEGLNRLNGKIVVSEEITAR